jgi:activating signal cointegrator complex subunit 3
VAIHHAGLDTADRTLVERLYLSGKIQVLICTATLAWGVNLPCHLVIVKGTEFFDGKIGRYVDMPVTDVLQMMGRAGRPQFDDHACAVIMAYEPKKHFYKRFLHEPFPVESSLHTGWHLHAYINAEVVAGTLLGLQDCVELLTYTYFFRRLACNPSYYHLTNTTPQGMNKYLMNLIKGVCWALHVAGCVECVDQKGNMLDRSDMEFEEDLEEKKAMNLIGDDAQAPAAAAAIKKKENKKKKTGFSDNSGSSGTGAGAEAGGSLGFGLQATALGRIASYYYLHYLTVGLFQRRLRAMLSGHTDSSSSTSAIATDTVISSTDAADAERTDEAIAPVAVTEPFLVQELVRLVSDSYEFAELPVRHNEDQLNAELAVSTYWPVDETTYASPHTKAYLLLQAHMSAGAIMLPIADYITDTKSVLDQVPRVLGALLEIAVLEKAAPVVQALAIISRHIAQGVPYLDDSVAGSGNSSNQQKQKQKQKHTAKFASYVPSELLQLPSITPALANTLQSNTYGINTVQQLIRKTQSANASSLNALLSVQSHEDKLLLALKTLLLNLF